MRRRAVSSAVRWSEFAAEAPELAEIGRGLLWRADQGIAAILATESPSGPHVAPVCPIFAATSGQADLYLLVGADTPKHRHLRGSGRYALHAPVGADDLEFQIGGCAELVELAEMRAAVLGAIPFPSFDPADPIYELLIERALGVSWAQPGVPRKQVWRIGRA